MRENLPPGKYDISFEDLKMWGGVPVIPKRPFIKKIRRDDPLRWDNDFANVLMFMVYPWVLYDERDGKPLKAFKTQETAFVSAVELVTAVPRPVDFAHIRERFDTDAMYRLFGAYGATFPSVRQPSDVCSCGHVVSVHDYASDGLYRNGCAVCDCKKARGYIRYEIDKRI